MHSPKAGPWVSLTRGSNRQLEVVGFSLFLNLGATSTLMGYFQGHVCVAEDGLPGQTMLGLLL